MPRLNLFIIKIKIYGLGKGYYQNNALNENMPHVKC